MRFWVALLLAVFMPLQLSWSAVGAYCQHETGKNASHFGHHSHEHQVSKAGASKQSDSAEGVAVDGDCGLCHYSALKILGQGTLSLPRCPVPSAPESTPAFFRTYFPPGPEKPNWLAAL